MSASLAYLDRLRATAALPLALGWMLLAWSAWRGQAASFAAPAIGETLARESRYGSLPDCAAAAASRRRAGAARGLLAALRSRIQLRPAGHAPARPRRGSPAACAAS